jgi:hypothetical protein
MSPINSVLSQSFAVATTYPKIVTNGLVLYLDAGNLASYPGTGTTWADLSSNRRNYSIDANNISWNSAGYFTCTGGTFTGPASNSFGFSSTNEHTIEAFVQVTSAQVNTFFDWEASPNTTPSDNRAIWAHLYYSNGSTYYDVSGCCDVTQRISYANDSDLIVGIRHLVWRTRTNTTPNRQFFKNTISQMDSGTNTTATVNWNLTTSATIGTGWYGNLHSFRAYNRALTDAEISQNFNALRGRYGI